MTLKKFPRTCRRCKKEFLPRADEVTCDACRPPWEAVCRLCGETFLTKSRMSRYCEACRREVSRRQRRQGYARKRAGDWANLSLTSFREESAACRQPGGEADSHFRPPLWDKAAGEGGRPGASGLGQAGESLLKGGANPAEETGEGLPEREAFWLSKFASRPLTPDTPYLVQKWHREGWSIQKIAFTLYRPVSDILFALTVPLTPGQRIAMEEFLTGTKQRGGKT